MTTRYARAAEADLLDRPTLVDCVPDVGDVVVAAAYGADGYEALKCAAMLAWAYGRTLRIVRVVREVDLLDTPGAPADARRTQAVAVVEDAVALVRSIAPTLRPRLQLEEGSLIDALGSWSTTAGLLVLACGTPHGRQGRRRVGAEDAEIAAWMHDTARCPVLSVDGSGPVRLSAARGR